MSGLSQEARALIDGVADLDGPSPADKARIQERLSMQLGAVAFAGSMLPHAAGGTLQATPSSMIPAHKSAWLGSLSKVGLSIAALAGVTVALVLGAPEKQRHLTRQAASTSAEKPDSAMVAADKPPAEHAPAPALANEAPTEAAKPVASKERTASVAKRAKSAAAAAPAAKTSVSPADAPAEDTLGKELALLGRAQAALRAGKAQDALAMAEEHARQFPEGVMKQERMGVAALAECAVSKDSRAHAHAFLKLAPTSPLATRVRNACGLE